jgi:hypothetical protein
MSSRLVCAWMLLVVLGGCQSGFGFPPPCVQPKDCTRYPVNR